MLKSSGELHEPMGKGHSALCAALENGWRFFLCGHPHADCRHRSRHRHFLADRRNPASAAAVLRSRPAGATRRARRRESRHRDHRARYQGLFHRLFRILLRGRFRRRHLRALRRSNTRRNYGGAPYRQRLSHPGRTADPWTNLQPAGRRRARAGRPPQLLPLDQSISSRPPCYRQHHQSRPQSLQHRRSHAAQL